MGHPQLSTPLHMDNYTAEGIVNITIVRIRSKAMYTSFYWLSDLDNQKNFQIYWDPDHEI